MSGETLTAFAVFHGESAGGRLCALVDGARRANAIDLLDRARSSGAFGTHVLHTDSETLAREAAQAADRVVITSGDGFHLGRALKAAARELGAGRICYVGSGAAPLLGPGDLAKLAERRTPLEVVANNLYSTDFCAFDCGPGLDDADLPATDNGLSRTLVERAGYAGREFPRAAATLFDIDAPLDLSALRIAGAASGRLGAYVEASAPAATHLEAAVRRFADREAEVLVAGRVSADTHLFLDRETACRVRFVTEERGIVACGEAGARSIVGMWLGDDPAASLATLGGRTHAAFLDTRLLLAHHGIAAPMEERFAADLLLAQAVRTPYLRTLAAAAAGAPYPVVLASHSLLNGGLMMLAEAVWRRLADDPSVPRSLRTRVDSGAARA